MNELIHMISGPRNLSTAIMYSFLNRSDTDAIDEPFYAYYLSHFDVSHPGYEEIISSQSKNANQVVSDLFHSKRAKPQLFIKNMAHHLRGFDYYHLFTRNTFFLIRNPAELIHSFSKVMSDFTAEDLGIIREYELVQEYHKINNRLPLILDSGNLLQDPKSILIRLCSGLNIQFEKSMLQWNSGPRKEDGVWAKYWYSSVHKSTHFNKKPTSRPEVDEKYRDIYEEVLPFYLELHKQSIKV